MTIPLSNFCINPWVHISANTDGTFRPCCLSQYTLSADDGFTNINDGVTIGEVWNSESMQTLRQQFLNNERPDGCRYCWNLEDGNCRSKRLNDNERFLIAGTEYKPIAEANPHYLDLKLGSICNLKCRICTPENSTRWIQDSKALNLYESSFVDHFDKTSRWAEDVPEFWKDLFSRMEDVTHIDFAGGEPLRIKAHLHFLRDVVTRYDVSDITLHYNTNGTVVPPVDILEDVWPKFKRVEIMVSIDGTDEKFEYMRHGASWDKVSTNLDTLRSFSYIDLQICHTVSILNAFDLPEFIVWCEKNDITSYINLLYHPAHYNVRAMPDAARGNLQFKYDMFIRSHTFKHQSDKDALLQISDYVGQGNNSLIDFIDITDKLDNHRNEDITKTFPGLSSYINEETNRDT